VLYWIAEQLGFPGALNLIRYQSFRTGSAVATALLIGLIIGPTFIGWLRVRQGKGQPIRADGPQTHLAKRGTPTMGGLMILTSMAMSILLWMDLSNPFVWACLFVTLGFGEIIRVFLNNLEYPINVTNGPRGIGQIDSFHMFGVDLAKTLQIGDFALPSVTLYYYLFLVLVIFTVIICYRLQDSRIGRALIVPFWHM